MWPFKKEKKKKRKYTRKNTPQKIYSKEEKLKLIREFEQTGAPITVFCKWYGLGVATLKSWQEKLKLNGEDALADVRGVKKAEPVAAAVQEEIIKLKIEKPGLGVKKIRDYMLRNRFVKVGRDSVEKILKEDPRTAELLQKKRTLWGNAGKEPQRFERSKPGEMYQMDIMTFMLQGLYRVYVIACLDDYSRFIVSIGVFRNQTSDKALDVLKNAIEKYGMPKEMLTDNGRQFYTWRGSNMFQKYLVKSGIRQIRSRPYHPQTLGKVESLWRNMYQELLSKEPIASFEEAQEKIGKWAEWYNFKRPHQGIGGLVPADRFFSVENSVKEVMEKGSVMVKEGLINDPRRIKEPVYLVGKIGGQEIRVIARDGSMTLNPADTEKINNNKGDEENGTADAAGTGNEHTETGGGAAGNKNRNDEQEVLQGHTGEGESESRADDTNEAEKTERDNGGNGGDKGSGETVEEQSNTADGTGVYGAGQEEGKKAEELCAGREPEGELSEGKGERTDPFKEGGGTGSREKKGETGPADSAAGNGVF